MARIADSGGSVRMRIANVAFAGLPIGGGMAMPFETHPQAVLRSIDTMLAGLKNASVDRDRRSKLHLRR